jgi:hypothetical protein
MSATIKFGSSPEEIHWVGELGADIWDMIYTYKEMAEKQTYFEKFDKLMYGFPGLDEKERKNYCKANKIYQSYHKRSGKEEKMARIVFATFGRKMPSPKEFPAGSGSGIGWYNKVENWCDEDRDLYLCCQEMFFCNKNYLVRKGKKSRWAELRSGEMSVCEAYDEWYAREEERYNEQFCFGAEDEPDYDDQCRQKWASWRSAWKKCGTCACPHEFD